MSDEYDVKAAREEWKRRRDEYQRRQDEAKADWIKLCVMSDGRAPKPLPIVENAYVALTHDPKLKDQFGFDEMLRKPTISNSTTRPVEDNDTIDLQRYLQRAGLKRIGRDTVWDAVCNYSREHPYHPVRDFLDSLKWDSTPRLDTWVNAYLGVETSDYAGAIGALFLISMVARIFEPGCKADHMLVLEGPQGRLKSQACEVLAGGYFSDQLPEITLGKEVSIHLAGKWLIEVAEMHAFTRAEATLLKSFLSRTHERYRPVYARIEVEEPRQCVLIGTSNKDTYLRDETGNRRFWPIKCGSINLDALRADRPQLLAEAVTRYHANHRWWPDPAFQEAFIQPEQDARYEHDEWTSIVGDYLTSQIIHERTTLAQVAKQALGLEHARLGAIEQKRISNALTFHGWEAKRTKKDRWWQPKG